MNVKLKMHYLTGGEQWFGSQGEVYTLTRKGYPQACPNAAKLLGNLTFTLDMENAIMAEVVDKKVSFDDAAKAWVKAHPQVLEGWLAGVTTKDDGDATAAVKAKL
jgi:glycine betaine/proline transport system substrate-binding protein